MRRLLWIALAATVVPACGLEGGWPVPVPQQPADCGAGPGMRVRVLGSAGSLPGNAIVLHGVTGVQGVDRFGARATADAIALSIWRACEEASVRCRVIGPSVCVYGRNHSVTLWNGPGMESNELS